MKEQHNLKDWKINICIDQYILEEGKNEPAQSFLPNNVEVPIILLDWKLDSRFGIGLSLISRYSERVT